ncbi:MAG: pyridoxamine 5'-phosphate oxidase family protein [bacterium]
MKKLVFAGMVVCALMGSAQEKKVGQSYLLVKGQTKDAFLEEMASFMATNNILYLATADADRPCVRPIRFTCLIDNKLAIATSLKKNMSTQMMVNSAVELCTTSANGKMYIRFSGKVSLCKDETLIAKYAEEHPGMKNKFGKDFALYLVAPENVGLWGGKEPKTKQFKAE